MRKKLCIILPVIVLCPLLLLLAGRRDASLPTGNVMNYLESPSPVQRQVLVTDNFIALKIPNGPIKIYDRTAKCARTLASSVFYDSLKYSQILMANADTLYVKQADTQRSGTCVAGWDLRTLDSSTLYCHNSIVDYNAFLGMGELLGIKKPDNDELMSIMGKADNWVDSSGVRDASDLFDLITALPQAAECDVNNVPQKYAANDCGLYFINDLSQLVFYSYDTGALKKLSDTRMSAFFLFDGRICCADMAGTGWSYMGTDGTDEGAAFSGLSVEYIRVHGNVCYLCDASGRVYRLNDGSAPVFCFTVSSQAWDADADELCYYDAEGKTLECREVSYGD